MGLAPGELINENYQIICRLGSGSYGDVYSAEKSSGRAVAIKIERQDSREYILRWEHKVYEKLHNSSRQAIGVPKIHYYGKHRHYNVLVMERLGKSLFHRLERENQFNFHTVSIIAIQMLYAIEYIHSCKFIHLDIKPSNMVTGYSGSAKRTTFLIDYGSALYYVSPCTGAHIDKCVVQDVRYTPDYAPWRVHYRKTLSRRDDLESLGYSLIEMARGSLPWTDVHYSSKDRYRDLGHAKKHMSAEVLCSNLPSPFIQFMQNISNLGFKEHPNYSQLRCMFRQELKSRNLRENGKFQWM